MPTIKAPFNFVPLSDQVYFPDWANKISQDIPFSDGIDGTIELEIIAKSPIFVRNGHTQEDAKEKNDMYKSFSKTFDDEYFIPATSIKGSIRNVFEIMSFSKMNKISNNRYSIRNLQLDKYMSSFQNSDIHCGWTTKKNNIINITDNGIPLRISHEQIDAIFGTDFCEKFSDKFFLKEDKNRSALIKYKMTKGKNLNCHYIEVPLNSENNADKRIKAIVVDKGKDGTIVFTGQPGERKGPIFGQDGNKIKKATGKFYEFIFGEEIIQSFNFDSEKEDGLYKDFCFVYKDSEEWKFWKDKLNKGDRIPVFFSLKDGKFLHFGLSYLYKLPYWGRIKDYLYKLHRSPDYDLSDCIFGLTNGDKSLKGRVQFSNAFCINGKPLEQELSPYMGGPKPTYYPIYLKQKGNNGYMTNKDDNKGVEFSTMLDRDAVLKGWKRYPIRDDWEEYFDIPEGQESNTNPFKPMEPNSIFTCIVHFHNLRKIELGALLNAIELKKGYCHSIGFAKPYGYGRVAIDIKKVDGFDINDCQSLKQDFIDFMSENIVNYSKSFQIKELNAMQHSQNLTSKLEYMELPNFVDCKKQNLKKDKDQKFGEYLPYYSELISRQSSSDQEIVYAESIVTFFDKNTKKAQLIEGKDQKSKELIMQDKYIKLKIGDKIQVAKILKGGNVVKLKFIKKL